MLYFIKFNIMKKYKVKTFNKSNKKGLAAQSTILCAGKLRPPAANVTSTKSP